jgi:hypothetical protein
MVTVDDRRLRSLPGPRPADAFIPNDTDGAFYWPIDGISVGNQLWLVCLRSYPGGPAGFRPTGVKLAAFDVPAGGDPVFRGTFSMPSTTGAFDAVGNEIGIAWDGAITVEGATAYVFGTRPKVGFVGNDLFLARVPAVSLSNPSLWQFWTGATWSSSATAATPLVHVEQGGVPGSFGLSRVPDGYSIVGTVDPVHGRDIAQWTSASLTGPWTRRAPILPAWPPALAPEEIHYGGYLIPEMQMSSGRTLLAYSRNGAWSQITAHANYYMVQFVEVTPSSAGLTTFAAPAPAPAPAAAPIPAPSEGVRAPDGSNPLAPEPRGLRWQRR